MIRSVASIMRNYTLTLADCEDVGQVGGKAANLGRLLRFGFIVPDGFAITTRAYRLAAEREKPADMPLLEIPTEVEREIVAAYAEMGGGAVAVRSSATAEDSSTASMAGQCETFLDIQGEAALLDAVCRCWASLASPRIQAYLREHAIDPSRVAMAVVVQRLAPADAAGVLFTANPNTGGRREMLLEASWGLGECVVSGRVQPDVLRIDAANGRVLSASIADKRIFLAPGATADAEVEEKRRRQPCLRGHDVHRLWQLGQRVAEKFGSPQDIEWAIAGGELFVLQSRPITTLDDAEAYESLLRDTRHILREEVKGGRGPWVLHNLAETLPRPTPLTWSVIQRFMSGDGGFGAMYRQAGFEPSLLACKEGFLLKIGGRIYMDASRAPEMFFENFPYRYDVEELKRSPDASQSPPTIPSGSFMERRRAGQRLAKVSKTLGKLSESLDARLRDQAFPDFERWCAGEKTEDLSRLSSQELISLWTSREQKVLDELGPTSLLPGLICGMAIGELRAVLAENIWDQDPDALSQTISAGGPPNRTVLADIRLFEVGAGFLKIEEWLRQHGHRAAGEFDLAAPRWREQPDAVLQLARRMADGAGPAQRHERQVSAIGQQVEAIRSRICNAERSRFDQILDRVRRYIAFREDGKDVLMRGYDLLRDLALEIGRRLDLGQDVFFLTREDMFDALRVGYAPLHLIDERKREHEAATRLTVPHVVDAGSIDSLGQVAELKRSDGYKAFAVSAGLSTGPARVVLTPTEAADLGEGYILVCPSTDPSWTPLFVNAAGLVLECGGTLSHGAVVAREMGLPAVVLPDATKLFLPGQAVQVDGHRGWVGLAPTGDAEQTAKPAELDADGPIAATRLPPPPSRGESTSAKLRNVSAILWGIYLVCVFSLPEKLLQQPSLTLLDRLLWPILRSLGKPGVTIFAAAAVASATLLLQKWLTDNRRLLEGKRRAAELTKNAKLLPPDSPQRPQISAISMGMQIRTMMAAMTPVALLLGPMVISFIWLSQRVDPSAWNAPAGSTVQVSVQVDSDWRGPVALSVEAPLRITGLQSQNLAPIRETLEKRVLPLLRQPAERQGQPWELSQVPDLDRQMKAASLAATLKAGLPPQTLTWQVEAPSDAAGCFGVTVSPQSAPTTGCVVLGEQYPPSPASVDGPEHDPIRSLTIGYPPPRQAPVFSQRAPWLDRLPWLPAWLWLYIGVYLLFLFALRTILRLA